MPNNSEKKYFLQNSSEHQELLEMIRIIVRDEIKNYVPPCRFDITDEEGKTLSQILKVTKYLGEGDLIHGLNISIENHKWLAKQRSRTDKLSMVFFGIIITSFVASIFTAVWAGIKHLLSK